MENKNNSLLKMVNINKSFPGVQALKNVNLFLEKGEILALVGENGAGKSVLIKILSGIYQKDSGDIFIDNKKVDIKNPKDAKDLGISTIYQDINIVKGLTIAENIFLGREKIQHFGLINKRKLLIEAQKLCDNFESGIDSSLLAENLSIAQQQMILVIKAIAFKTKIVIMDEVTAFLTDNEIRKLFKYIEILKEKKISLIYISHNLPEIFEISDNVVVLRDGINVNEDRLKTKSIDKDSIVRMIVGRKIQDYFPSRDVKVGNTIFKVSNFTGKSLLESISFELKSGEILGIYGLVGSGRSELAETIFGIRETKDSIRLVNSDHLINSPSKAINIGISLIPEDRRIQGLILGMSVRKNVTLATLKNYVKYGFLLEGLEKRDTHEYIKKLKIKVTSSEQIVNNLSGGNQQKVVLAKWLKTNPKVLIMDEPTKGIDVGAKVEIYSLMNSLVSEGIGIIFISSELPEVLAMSDRIMIMRAGKLVKILDKSEANSETVLKYATGILN